MDELSDAAVVEAFVNHLATLTYPWLKIDTRPGVYNRNSADIDAAAGPFAIEHTSIDALAHQRRDGSRFMELAQPLEDEFRDRLPFRLRLIFPYEGNTDGQDWSCIQSAIRRWVVDEAPGLPDGAQAIRIGATCPFRSPLSRSKTHLRGSSSCESLRPTTILLNDLTLS